MIIETVEDILPLIEKPSHYIGGEINSIHKNPQAVQLRIALGFPDLYEIGTSHFGIQILYHILNLNPAIQAERVYTPAEDMAAFLKKSGIPLMSLETRTPLKRFDLIGFSLLYELNYTNILTMLDLAGIPFYARERDLEYPLIIAGGPCACNPEPVAPFFDAVVIGDGEDVAPALAEIVLKWKQGPQRSNKESLLFQWAEIEGVYIPAFFDEPAPDDAWKPEIATLKARHQRRQTVRRAVLSDLDAAPFPTAAVIPFGRPVHDRLRLEIARGCTRGCRFCQAGMIYRPVRERSVAKLIQLAENALDQTGYGDISLLSLSSGDYSHIIPLMERLMARCASEHIAVSLPSMRAGTLTPEMAQMIQSVRKTGFTIAPEAGSQRLRNVINKNITQSEILETVHTVFEMGWSLIKLYFMVGLPTELDEDLEAIVDLVKSIRQVARSAGKGHRRRGQITVSVGAFVPKPHTPFQWHPQISLPEARRKIEWLKRKLKMSGVQFKWQNPRISQIEGLFARGDRRLSPLLVKAYEKGCHLDGWSDRFRYELWQEALDACGIDIDFYTTRHRAINEKLPWSHIDMRISDPFLMEEWKRSQDQILTADCRDQACGNCGVCDFKHVQPQLSEKPPQSRPNHAIQANLHEADSHKVKIYYQKYESAKYFGHLEMVNIFNRAVKRGGLKVKYSQGFHPKARIAFNDPLPIGVESLDESFQMTLYGEFDSETVVQRLNAFLPKGLQVFKCEREVVKTSTHAESTVRYGVTLRDGIFEASLLDQFLKSESHVISKTNRKGKTRQIDLKKVVVKMERPTPDYLNMVLKLEKGVVVRPDTIIQSIFNLSETKIKQARIVKAYSGAA